jgi:hypothetical protein
LNGLGVHGDNIKKDLENRDGRQIYVAQDRYKWRAVVNTAVTLGVSIILGIS